MKIGRPRRILDPYAWLPGCGESSVTTRSAGLELIIDIGYERRIGSAAQAYRRQLVFDGTFTVLQTFFPGPSMFEIVGETDFRLGDLTEFQDSQLCRNITSWFNWSAGRPRHFAIQFLAQNLSFHVVARSVFLTEEHPVN